MPAFVPTGTVLLVITMASAGRCGASESTTAHSAERSAEPSSELGVPTARKTSLALLTALAKSVVKLSRLAATLRCTSSVSPGS